eukprot:scaffold116702_cov36-Attheya_sp.AAC.1
MRNTPSLPVVAAAATSWPQDHGVHTPEDVEDLLADLDMRGLLAVYRRCCDRAAAVMGGDGWVWGLLVLPLLKLQPLRGVGVGLVGKGGMVGSGTKLSFGAIRSQWWCVAQQVGEKDGLNEEDNSIMLQ